MASEIVEGARCELLGNDVLGEAEIEPYTASKFPTSCEFGKDRASEKGCSGEGGSCW